MLVLPLNRFASSASPKSLCSTSHVLTCSRTELGLQLSRDDSATTRSNTAGHNRTSADREADCDESALSFGIHDGCKPRVHQTVNPGLLNPTTPVLTSPFRCGEIKVKVCCGRIKSCPRLLSPFTPVTILVLLISRLGREGPQVGLFFG